MAATVIGKPLRIWRCEAPEYRGVRQICLSFLALMLILTIGLFRRNGRRLWDVEAR